MQLDKMPLSLAYVGAPRSGRSLV